MNKFVDKENKAFKPGIYNRKVVYTAEKEISFFVTDNCNLKCTYCYLPGKNRNRRMTFETAKKALDYFLTNPDLFNEPKLLLDFMGGEPILEVELMDQIVDYFKVMAYKLDHHWFYNYRVQITTNGTLCTGEAFKRFCRKNRDRIVLSVSIDGTKEVHDKGRIYYNDQGCYDDVIRNIKEIKKLIPNVSIKSTISSSTIASLKDSFLHLWKLGKLKEVYSNLVYEDCWKEGDDIVYENQLKELADHLIDTNLFEKHEITYFEEFENIGTPYSKYLLKKHWCNCGEQISISPEGVFYPCTRFQELSLQSDRKGRNIGNVDDGIDFDKLRPFRLLNIESCSSERCLSCDVATGCGLCSGLSYDCSEEETIFSRTEFICKMHKARVRARDYYFDKLKKVKNAEKNKTHFYTAQLTAPKNVLNVMLGSDSVNGCGYDQSAGKDGEAKRLDRKVLEEYLALAKKEQYFVNLIYPESPLDDDYQSMLAGLEAQRTRPYGGENRAYQFEDATVFVFRVGQEPAEKFSSINVIVLAGEEDIPKMASYVEGLFKRGVLRINLVLDFSTMNTDFNIIGYKEQLEKIADVIFDLQKTGRTHYLNVLSDIGNSEEMNNCNAGLNHVTLGFDGKLYLCPAAAYRGEPVETEAGTLKVVPNMTANLELSKSPLCSKCDAFHCRRCVLDNVTRTNEYRVPGEMQCILSHVEREVGRNLQDRMVKELNMSFANRVRELEYYDPFKKAKVW